MKRFTVVSLIALATFCAGIAIAKAEYGWIRVSAPCNVQSLAISGSEIAVTCQGAADTILIKQR